MSSGTKKNTVKTAKGKAKKRTGVARLSDTGISVVVLVRDTDIRGVEVLTTWEDGESLFYDAIDEFGWLVKGYEDELVAVKTGDARDETVRLARVPLRTLA